MGAVAIRARSELRHRTRASALLVLAVGIAAGASLAAFAGARRTETSIDRFLAYSRPAQVIVGADRALYPRISRLPQVEAVGQVARPLMAVADERADPNGLSEIATDNPGIGRPILLSGRLPNPEHRDEVVLNPTAAAHLELRPGSSLHLRAFAQEQAGAVLNGSASPPTGPDVSVRVVGIARFPVDLTAAEATPGVSYTGNDGLFLTPAFFRAYKDRVALAGGIFLNVRLRGGSAQFPSFAAAVAKLSAGKAFVAPGSDDLTAAAAARHATRVEALALFLFGLIGSLITLALIAQALARLVHLDAAEYPVLRAIGMTRAQLVSVSVIRAALIGFAGAVCAVAVAITASRWMPIGLARQAEVDRGTSIDAAILTVGMVTIVTALTAWTAVVAWRAAADTGAPRTRRVSGRHRASRLAMVLSDAGAPPSATVGATMVFDSGRGSDAIPARTAIASAVLAVTVVAGALTFGFNLTRIADHPRLQGWNWDVAVGNPHSEEDVSATAVPLLSRNRAVAAISAISGAEGNPARIAGHDVGLFAIDIVKGPGLVPYPEGRAPRTADEIAFGTSTLRKLHLAVGQRVGVSAGGPTRTMRITGRVLLTPTVVNGSVPLGEGAVVSKSAFRALHADAPVTEFLVRLSPGADRSKALKQLRADFPGTVLTATRPSDIENLRRVDHVPTLLALLLALVALLTIGNTLVSSIRRRRRDLAILRTVGFVRRQVAAVVAWQASAVAIIATLIGVPLGAALGRAIWTVVTDRLGLPPDTVTPVNVLALVALAALIAANVVAIVPGLLASRTAPATTLRAE